MCGQLIGHRPEDEMVSELEIIFSDSLTLYNQKSPENSLSLLSSTYIDPK